MPLSRVASIARCSLRAAARAAESACRWCRRCCSHWMPGGAGFVGVSIALGAAPRAVYDMASRASPSGPRGQLRDVPDAGPRIRPDDEGVTGSLESLRHAVSAFGDRLGDTHLLPLLIALGLHFASLMVRSGVWCGILRAAFPE